MSSNMSNQAALAVSNAMADAVERAAQMTVMVNARRRLPLSGILYAPDLILTADHGVEREENIRIGLPDGRDVEATIAGRDRGSDLALLRLSGAQGTPAQVAPQEARVGNLVLAVGRPGKEGVQASLGLVNALGQNLRTPRGGTIERYIMADATPYPGFSGGPLVDLSGGLLGINTSGLIQGTSLAIPAGLAWQLAANLAQHGHVRRGYLGIRSQPVEIPAQARTDAVQQESGLLVIGVESDGPSASALMVGDIVVGIAGKPVANHEDLLALLVGDTVGRSTGVQVLRGGQLKTVQITIGERK